MTLRAVVLMLLFLLAYIESVSGITKYVDLATCQQCMIKQQYWPWLSYCTKAGSPYYKSCTDVSCGQAITEMT